MEHVARGVLLRKFEKSSKLVKLNFIYIILITFRALPEIAYYFCAIFGFKYDSLYVTYILYWIFINSARCTYFNFTIFIFLLPIWKLLFLVEDHHHLKTNKPNLAHLELHSKSSIDLVDPTLGNHYCKKFWEKVKAKIR